MYFNILVAIMIGYKTWLQIVLISNIMFKHNNI